MNHEPKKVLFAFCRNTPCKQAHSSGRPIDGLTPRTAFLPSCLLFSLRSVAAGSHFFHFLLFSSPSVCPSLSLSPRHAGCGRRIGRDDACYTISWLRLAPAVPSSLPVIHPLIPPPSIIYLPDNTMHGILIAIEPNLRYAFRESHHRSS